jgi:DNA polymerase I-like protein with 3'-5' exonuclease and polymerase domains
VNGQFKYNGNAIKAAYPKCVACPIGYRLTADDLPKEVKIYVSSVGYVNTEVEWDFEEIKTTKLGVSTIEGRFKDITLELDPEVRKEFKTSWNALTYGQTKEGLKSMCKNIDGNVLWDKFNSIDGLKNWRLECSKKARKDGDKEVFSYFGERMVPDGYNSSAIARQLMDYEIQGTGADILELLVRNFEENSDSDLEIYYTRHDELIILAGKDTVDSDVESRLRMLFEHQVDDWKPFEVEIKRVV